tara:strand:- start:156 stop:1370 length:1215 start_codon:yes stop_codon:yes gene_type:complete
MPRILILIFFFVSACSSPFGDDVDDRIKEFDYQSTSKLDVSEEVPIKQFDIDLIEKIRSAEVEDVFTSRRYIHLKTPAEIIIGKIEKIVRHDNSLLVLDRAVSEKVVLFDHLGNFMFQVGKEGSGPGEYTMPWDIFMNESFIYVMDRTFVLHRYDYNNNFIDSKRLPIFAHSMFTQDDSTFLFANNKLMVNELSNHIIKINGDKVEATMLPIKGEAWDRWAANPFSYNPTFHGESFLHAPFLSNKIYEINTEGLKVKYKLKGDLDIPLDILNSPDRMLEFKNGLTYFYTHPVLETSTKLLLVIASPGKFMTVIYDKTTDQAQGYGGVRDNLFQGALQSFPKYAYGEEFYSILEVEELLALKGMLEADAQQLEEFKESNPEAFALMQQINDGSNPIIMVSDITIQ